MKLKPRRFGRPKKPDSERRVHLTTRVRPETYAILKRDAQDLNTNVGLIIDVMVLSREKSK